MDEFEIFCIEVKEKYGEATDEVLKAWYEDKTGKKVKSNKKENTQDESK
jgi:hypothetical protein